MFQELTTSQRSGGNVLQMMYEKPERWAYTFQSYACISRIRAQTRSASRKLTMAQKLVQFFERSVYSDRYQSLTVISYKMWVWMEVCLCSCVVLYFCTSKAKLVDIKTKAHR